MKTPQEYVGCHFNFKHLLPIDAIDEYDQLGTDFFYSLYGQKLCLIFFQKYLNHFRNHKR